MAHRFPRRPALLLLTLSAGCAAGPGSTANVPPREEPRQEDRDPGLHTLPYEPEPTVSTPHACGTHLGSSLSGADALRQPTSAPIAYLLVALTGHAFFRDDTLVESKLTPVSSVSGNGKAPEIPPVDPNGLLFHVVDADGSVAEFEGYIEREPYAAPSPSRRPSERDRAPSTGAPDSPTETSKLIQFTGGVLVKPSSKEVQLLLGGQVLSTFRRPPSPPSITVRYSPTTTGGVAISYASSDEARREFFYNIKLGDSGSVYTLGSLDQRAKSKSPCWHVIRCTRAMDGKAATMVVGDLFHSQTFELPP